MIKKTDRFCIKSDLLPNREGKIVAVNGNIEETNGIMNPSFPNTRK